MFKMFNKAKKTPVIQTTMKQRNTTEILGEEGDFRLSNIMFDDGDIELILNTKEIFSQELILNAKEIFSQELILNAKEIFSQKKLSEMSPSDYKNVTRFSIFPTGVVLALNYGDEYHFLKLIFSSNPPNIKVGTQIDEVHFLENNKPIKMVERTSLILSLNDISLVDYIKQNKLDHLPGAIKFLEFCSNYPTDTVLFKERGGFLCFGK